MFSKIFGHHFARSTGARLLSLHAVLALALLLPASGARAQTTGTTPPAPPMDHSKMGMAPRAMVSDPLGVPMDRGGSGTTWIPDAVQLPTYNVMKGQWDLMLHGFAFAQYNAQSGTRGDKQFGSLNWGMFMASRDVKGGRFQARTMLSIDAATVGPRGYPLLLQSGEVYDGQALHDRQHPHDFFMELGVTYERPINQKVGVALYAAPSGEPALGPVAFMHRPSSMDLPTAPISHHWQDATHVAFGVLSAGLFTKSVKLEGSFFNGREPDQHRWNFDRINFDSYSMRLSLNPDKHWALTAGYGYLKSPEALYPTEAVNRVVLSAMHGAQFRSEGQWASTIVYGRNKHSSNVDDDDGIAHNLRPLPGASFANVSLANTSLAKISTSSATPAARNASVSDVSTSEANPTYSVLIESELVVDSKNTVFGRAEYVQKTAADLVLEDRPGGPFSAVAAIKTLSLGYVRELKTIRGATLGLGGMGTLNMLPPKLDTWYGTRTPVGGIVFLRLRPVLKRGGMAMNMPGMKH